MLTTAEVRALLLAASVRSADRCSVVERPDPWPLAVDGMHTTRIRLTAEERAERHAAALERQRVACVEYGRRRRATMDREALRAEWRRYQAASRARREAA